LTYQGINQGGVAPVKSIFKQKMINTLGMGLGFFPFIYRVSGGFYTRQVLRLQTFQINAPVI